MTGTSRASSGPQSLTGSLILNDAPQRMRGGMSKTVAMSVFQISVTQPKPSSPGLNRAIQYAATHPLKHCRLWNTGCPAFAEHDSEGCEGLFSRDAPAFSRRDRARVFGSIALR
jgi:hypothetical protein